MTSGARCRGVRRGCKEGAGRGVGGRRRSFRPREWCAERPRGICPGHDSVPRATGRSCPGRGLRGRMSGVRAMAPAASGLLSLPSPRSCRQHAPLPICGPAPHRGVAIREAPVSRAAGCQRGGLPDDVGQRACRASVRRGSPLGSRTGRNPQQAAGIDPVRQPGLRQERPSTVQ